MATQIRRPDEPEAQGIDMPTFEPSPRRFADRRPEPEVPAYDSGEGDTPTGQFPTLAEAFPPPAPRPPRAPPAKVTPEPDFLADGTPDLTPRRREPDVFGDYSGLGSAVASNERAFGRLGSTPPEPDLLDRGPAKVTAPLPTPPAKVAAVDLGIDGGDSVRDALAPNAPPAELPAQVAQNQAPKPTVRVTPRAAPPPPSRSAPPVEGAGGDTGGFSEYDSLRQAISGAPVEDYTWASRLAADASNIGRPDRKPNYAAAEDNARAVQTAREAPARAYAQGQALAQAKQADTDRAPLDGAYLDSLEAPRGLNKAGLKDWLAAQVQRSTIDKNDRGSDVLQQFDAWKQDNPEGSFEQFMQARGKSAPGVLAAGINSGQRAKTATEIQGMKNESARLRVLAQNANEANKLVYKAKADELDAQIARETNTSRERIAVDNRAAADARYEQRAVDKELGEVRKTSQGLVDARSAIDQIRANGEIEPISVMVRIANSLPLGVGQQLLTEDDLRNLGEREAFRAFQTRLETGLAMTESERRDAQSRFGAQVLGNAEAFSAMLDFYEETLDRKIRQLQIGMRPKTRAIIQREGGLVEQSSPKGAAPTVIPTPGKVRVQKLDANGNPDGEPYEIDADDPRVAAAEKATSKYRVTRP